MPSWGDCGGSVSLNLQKGQEVAGPKKGPAPGLTYIIILLKQGQMLAVELILFLKYPLPPATRQVLHLFEVGTTPYVLTSNAIRLCKSMLMLYSATSI